MTVDKKLLSDSVNSELHRRQFVIGSKPVKYRADWRTVELDSECFLSHCPNLPVKSSRDTDGMVWHLIGIAVQTEPHRLDPLDEIACTPTAEIPSCYRYWSGRWVLIGNGEVHLDATGLLGCYYLTNTSSAKRHTPWASSSPALLAEVAGDRVGREDPHELRRGVGINWFPLPRSRFSCMAHLLPSQVLRLKDGAILKRLLFKDISGVLSYEQILDRLQVSLLTFMHRMPIKGRTVWLALTGGFDSRLLLAVVSKSGIPVRTYTQEYKGMSLGDRLLPEKIAAIVGLEHVFVRTAKFDKQKAALYDAHTARSHAERDRDFWARNQWRFANKGDLILRASCFEVGRYLYRDKLPGRDLPSPEKLLRAFGEPAVSTMKAGMAEWIDWVKQTPHEGLAWQDRFHIEQRLAGWLSSDMQSWDLTHVDHLNPISSSNAFELLLKIPPKLRAKGQHHIDIIRRIAPELLKVPVNPTGNYFNLLTKLYWHWAEDALFPIKYVRRRMRKKAGG